MKFFVLQVTLTDHVQPLSENNFQRKIAEISKITAKKPSLVYIVYS
jgi:hypothetical protein